MKEETQRPSLMPFPQGRREYSAVTSKTPSLAEFSKRVLLPHAGHHLSRRATSILEYSIPLVLRRIFRAGIYVAPDSLPPLECTICPPLYHRPPSDSPNYRDPTVPRWRERTPSEHTTTVLQHILVPIQRCHVA